VSRSDPALVVVRGGGDLGTGAARRLFLAGLAVLVTERPEPWCVRRRTAFAAALADDRVTVEGVVARRFTADSLHGWHRDRCVAVIAHPGAPFPASLRPDLLVDARVLKHGHDTHIDDAPWVVGVGPGFRPGRDCHAAVETVRGHDLGRVLRAGETRPFDGNPGELGGERSGRVLRAPGPGRFTAIVAIGDRIAAGARIGVVDGAAVRTPIGGVVRGLIAERCRVREHQKVGDVDPRDDPSLCESLSDKANAVGGGVVEATLALLAGRADC
jgi:xanthine dehydrogenase accessory factor